MCKSKLDGAKQNLLVVLPGASGRRPVLERLQAISTVTVLVPSSDAMRCSWARSLVSNDRWIEWQGTTEDLDGALSAVKAWISEDQATHCIDGAMTYDDFGTELCAHICDCLGLRGTPLESVRNLRNKHWFRERCAASHIPAAKHAALKTDEDLERLLSNGQEWPFPSVLKPLKGAGSWYITKVESAEELRQIWPSMLNRMQSGSFPADVRDAGFTLEEYFAGVEVDIDGWARDGKVEYCLVSDNRPAVEPYFLELGGYYPSQLPSECISALECMMRDVVSAFPGLHTCFHFEAKINPVTGEMMPIEFNARLGGAECPASVEAVTGYYLPEVAACIALGLPANQGEKRYSVVASANLYATCSGILEECSDKGIHAVSTNLVTSVLFKDGVGRQVTMHNGSQSCLGWVSAGGNSAEEAERNLQLAIGQMCISVTSECT